MNYGESPTQTSSFNRLKPLLIVSCVLLIALVGLFVLVFIGTNGYRHSSTQTDMSPVTIILGAEQPPLHPGIKWEAPESGRFDFTTRTGKVITVGGYMIKSEVLTPDRIKIQLDKELHDYYDSQLAARGWNRNRWEDGAYSGGEVWGYEKDGMYITIGYDRYNSEGEEALRAYVTYSVTTTPSP